MVGYDRAVLAGVAYRLIRSTVVAMARIGKLKHTHTWEHKRDSEQTVCSPGLVVQLECLLLDYLSINTVNLVKISSTTASLLHLYFPQYNACFPIKHHSPHTLPL